MSVHRRAAAEQRAYAEGFDKGDLPLLRRKAWPWWHAWTPGST